MKKNIGHNIRILVIDDDEALRDTYRGILLPEKESGTLSMGRTLFDMDSDEPQPPPTVSQKRYDLTMAENGSLGIEQVKDAIDENRPFAVAFIDMKMPGLNGAETSAEIWKIDPDIKIIIVTAYSEFTLDKIIETTGRQDILFLRKPFYSEEIQQLAGTMTHIWNLESSNRNHMRILEQTVAEKTSELRKANRRLKKTDSEKSAFIHYLSHEINTPLGWIGATQMMEKHELSEQNSEFLAFVEQGFERLSEFVTQMISYFDIAGSEVKIQTECVSLHAVITDFIYLVQQEIQRKKLTVRTAVSEEISICADPELLNIVVHVFVENAVKYSDPEGVIIIDTHEDDGSVILSVKNWGCGIEQERIDRIFDPFANLEAFRHKDMGFGLNLPKAKVIADLNEWDIKAWSNGSGEETGFSVQLDRYI